MVDTINSTNGQPDSPTDDQSSVQSTVPENRFYNGFDRPDETKINLADSLQPKTPSQETPAPATPTSTPEEATYGPITTPPASDLPPVTPTPPQVSEIAVPVAPEAPAAPPAQSEPQHTSYTNTGEAINWRGVLVISAAGLAVTGLLGAGLYFGITLSNNKKLDEQQTAYDSLQSELTALRQTPVSLELPQTEVQTPPLEQPPVVVPVVPPVETPVVAPSTTVSPKDNQGAALGTG